MRFARYDGGYCVRLEGRGTMKESPCVQDFVARCLGEGGPAAGSLVLDLTACTYLDSTFLGCILGLNRRFAAAAHGARGGAAPGRFVVAAAAEKRAALFGPLKVGGLLHFVDVPPAAGAWVTLAPQAIDSSDRARHVMECHRQLASLPGPQQAAFTAIADHLARELKEAGKRA